MYSVIGLLRRADEMSTGDFRSWWQEQHVPHVMQMPGLREYVLYPIDERLDGATGEYHDDPPYDGVAVITFDSKEAFLESFASPEGQADNQSFNRGAPSSTVLCGEAFFHLRADIPDLRVEGAR
jgi:uncharacterized protein (TIGR02118 family)